MQALQPTSFPMVCSNCGKPYSSFEDFLNRTTPVMSGSGLMDYNLQGAGKKPSDNVTLFRNCSCKSTLMVYCSDRRDYSPQGLLRKRVFGKMLEQLEELGLSRETARGELLKVVYGKRSHLLKKMNFDTSLLKNLSISGNSRL